MVTEAFFSWANLATFSGAVAAVVFIVQFLKLPLDRLKHVSTRVVVYCVSFAVLLIAQYFSTNAFSFETVVLALLNAVLVSLSAMALYEQAISEPEEKKNAVILDGLPLEMLYEDEDDDPPFDLADEDFDLDEDDLIDG